MSEGFESERMTKKEKHRSLSSSLFKDEPYINGLIKQPSEKFSSTILNKRAKSENLELDLDSSSSSSSSPGDSQLSSPRSKVTLKSPRNQKLNFSLARSNPSLPTIERPKYPRAEIPFPKNSSKLNQSHPNLSTSSPESSIRSNRIPPTMTATKQIPKSSQNPTPTQTNKLNKLFRRKSSPIDSLGSFEDTNICFLQDSTIISFLHHKMFILQWLVEEELKGNESLLWRATRDGFSSQSFHEYCDDKGPTLVIIRANNKIFGGFSYPSWKSSGGWIPDETMKSFIFSLDNTVKLKKGGKYEKGSDKAICGHQEYGPWFGQSDLRVCSNSDKKKGSVTQLGYSYQLPEKITYSGKSSWVYLTGEELFYVQEIEVWKIE